MLFMKSREAPQAHSGSVVRKITLASGPLRQMGPIEMELTNRNPKLEWLGSASRSNSIATRHIPSALPPKQTWRRPHLYFGFGQTTDIALSRQCAGLGYSRAATGVTNSVVSVAALVPSRATS